MAKDQPPSVIKVAEHVTFDVILSIISGVHYSTPSSLPDFLYFVYYVSVRKANRYICEV